MQVTLAGQVLELRFKYDHLQRTLTVDDKMKYLSPVLQTTCVIYDPESKVPRSIGMCRSHFRDQPSYEQGRRISLTRCIRYLQRDDRANIWGAYLTHLARRDSGGAIDPEPLDPLSEGA